MVGFGHERKKYCAAVKAGGAVLLFFLLTGLPPTTPSQAESLRYLRIGTGPPGESYFPIGGLIASAISNPPGSPPCDQGGSCGVPNVIAAASATNGSVSNAEAIGDGSMDAALMQADVAMWADQGAPPFQGRPITNLRLVANLYANQLHLVALSETKITSPRDLKGKRVSLGAKGSGTLVHARQILAAWNVKESDVKVSFLPSAIAADAIVADTLDAFFVVDGAPVPSIVELAKRRRITLVPIAGPGAEKLRDANHLLRPAIIGADVYEGVSADVATLQVGVDLMVSAGLSNDLVYGITKALWHPHTAILLRDGAPQAALITPSMALVDIARALHPGALRFYKETGLLN
ncbi:MAG TPA: TAXI family TRAP transporter solute-binding subunit [Telmatospirillum sp.]|nr:TAXI family TRAP transporter solute-binding subunit [Telmatospirillum sp.]